MEGGNKKLGHWYGRAKHHSDKMCSWILTEDDELIVRSNIRHARKTERPNPAFELESQHVKGSLKNFRLVNAKQIYKDNAPGSETKAGPQIFNPPRRLDWTVGAYQDDDQDGEGVYQDKDHQRKG